MRGALGEHPRRGYRTGGVPSEGNVVSPRVPSGEFLFGLRPASSAKRAI